MEYAECGGGFWLELMRVDWAANCSILFFYSPAQVAWRDEKILQNLR